MKTVFERWDELEPYHVMPVTAEELDLFCSTLRVAERNEGTPSIDGIIIGRHGVTFLCGDRIVSHREYRR